MISKKITTTHLQTEMAEIPNPTYEIGESKMVLSDQERSANVVLDIESLAPFTDKNKELASTPKSTLQGSLSRKGSYRVLKKISERETVETPKQASSSKGTGLNGTPEKCVMVPVTTQLLNSSDNSNKCRRYNKRKPWADPGKILFIFATMSSMGTLLLIYFTLATSSNINGDAQSQ